MGRIARDGAPESWRFPLGRAIGDLGLAVWFGGSLMGALGLDRAAASVQDPRARTRVFEAGRQAWQPAERGAIASYVAGSLLAARIVPALRTQAVGVAAAGLTAAALVVTVHDSRSRRATLAAGDVPVAGPAEPLPTTPPVVAAAQRAARRARRLLPVLTGGLVALRALRATG